MMRYKPGLPEHNDNVTHTHPIKELATLLGGLLLLLAIAYYVLGLLVDFSVSRISPELEQKWFKQSSIDKAVSSVAGEGKAPSSDISDLFQSLQTCTDIRVDLSLQLVESELVNAIAIPGGSIVVYSGLINKLETENGLAFVLAHELAHFKHRDHLRALGRGLVLTLLASAVTGSDSGIVRVLAPVSLLEQARYSQSRESSADDLALDILNCHYGHVAGATEFFEAMQIESERQFVGEHYFSSHPEVKARIADLNVQIREQGYFLKGTIPLDK